MPLLKGLEPPDRIVDDRFTVILLDVVEIIDQRDVSYKLKVKVRDRSFDLVPWNCSCRVLARSRALEAWAMATEVQLCFIRSGHPVENGFIESFNGRLRDECLNVGWFSSLDDARAKLAKFREHYNRETSPQCAGRSDASGVRGAAPREG